MRYRPLIGSDCTDDTLVRLRRQLHAHRVRVSIRD
jgi:hypothetical protein